MEIVNLTPHDIIIIRDGEIVLRLSPSGKVAKVAEVSIPDGELAGIPVVRKQYGEVQIHDRSEFLAKVPAPKAEPMPEPQAGIIYVVPMLVGQVLSGSRMDIVGPDFGIGGATRTKDGQITGASGFIRF